MGTGEAMRIATLLVAIMILAPFAQAVETPYTGNLELVIETNPNGSLTNLTEDAFAIPANSTILDGWVNVSTGANGEGGTGTHWIANNPNLNFSHGSFNDSSISIFDDELTLGVNHTVGRLDELETLSMRFQQYSPGGTGNVWRMAEPSQFNGAFAMNYSARQAAGGLIPSLATDGSLVAATLPEDPVPAGTHAWLTSPSSAVPNIANQWTLSFNHWYHLHHTNSSTGSSGAWLEVSLDGGQTWTYIEPIGGYTWNISTTAPIPNGAPGVGFGVFGGPNASGWVNSSFDISHLHSSNHTGLQHRFVLWTDPIGMVNRPGWYVDEVTISNDGETPGAWFHGSLIGEYAPDAHAHLTVPVQVNMSNSTSGAWMIRYWTDFDLEGGSWDKFEVQISSDNLSWYRMSPVGGIPGPYGLTIGGRTIMEDTGGWVEVAHPFPSSFSMPANGTFMIRIVVETDQMPSSGYGGALDPPEGVFIDDVSITRTISGITETMWSENFTTDAGAWHDLLPGGAYNQWQYLNNWGNNGPSESTWSFEDAPLIADGWSIHTPYGQSWAFGSVSNTSGWGPSAWPSGQVGVAMGLNNRHAANSWSHLISPSYHIPLGASARVSFDHFICAEVGWDGGVLYTSIDNGTSWQIYGQDIPQFYDVQHWNNPQSPLYQQWAWDGSNQKGGGCTSNKSFSHVEGDLSNFGGHDVMLRFSFFSDTFIEMDGWYIDNVGVIVDWFESSGSWTSDLVLENTHGFAPTIDIDARVPDGAWVKASLVDTNGTLMTGLLHSQNLSFPLIPSMESYRVRVEFGTSNHQLTPRILGLHSGAIRILNPMDGTNGWDIPNSLNHDNVESNITNPTLNTVRVSGSSAYGDAPIEEVSIIAESAGALYQLWDGQGSLLASGVLGNQSISLPYAAVNIRPTIDLQPGGWVRYASFVGELGTPMNNGVLDVGGDGVVDWSWNATQNGAFGWFDGNHLQHNLSLTQWAPPGTVLDQGTVLHASEDITWTWANGHDDSLDSGEYRILDSPWTTIQNQSNVSHFSFIGMAISWDSTVAITGLGPGLRTIQSDAINGTGPAIISAGELQIPIVLQADIGGVSLSGSISHAQRIVNVIDSVPSGTMVPEQNVTIISTHSHLFNRNLLHQGILRMQSNSGINIEVHVEDISAEPVAIQTFGAEKMALTSVSVTAAGSMGFRIYWNFQTQWAFDDADSITVLAEVIEGNGFTLGPASSMIGGSNYQAMENDLEVVSWQVRDEQSRLLSNEWDARYPLHAKSGSTISITGTVRFEGQANVHPSPDAYTVALELNGNNVTSQSIGVSGESGAFSATIELPNGSGNVSISPWILQIGPLGTSIFGAEDASAGELFVEVKTDPNPPRLGPLMIYTPNGGQLADGNILSPERTIPFWIEVHDDELLDTFVSLRCWFESYDDTDQDGVPDQSEYGENSQFLGGSPRGTIRIDFPAVGLSMMEENDRISCYIEGGDYAGHTFAGGGGPGFENDIATMVVQTQEPTQLSLPSITLDRHEEMSLLMGIEHTFSFTLQDSNGLESIDSIELDIAGDGRGVVEYHPLNGTLSSIVNSPVVPLSVETESLGDDAYLVEISFAINFGAPEDWLQGQWIPSLRIEEDGESVTGANSNLQHLAWALDNRLMWRVDTIEDLTPPSMPIFENKLSLQPGDSMSFTASIVHRELNQKIAIELPDQSAIEINVLGGEVPYTVYTSATAGGFTTTVDFDANIWMGPTHAIQFGLANHTGLNTSLPDMAFDVAIDNVAPRIDFQSTSLVQLRSDSLSNQLVSFTIEDEGGMGEQGLTLHWIFRREGLDISGSKSSVDMGLGVHSDGLWVYSNYVNLTPDIVLVPGDILLVWVEGQDLAGNQLQGPGTEYSPRIPALEIMHFTPDLVSIWIDNDQPEVGEMIQIDARIHNIGNLAGELNISLWAWEPQPNSEPLIIQLESQETSLDARQSLLLRFEFEAWREGDLQLYFILNGDSDSRIPIDIAPIREEGASLSWFERVFGDGPLVVSMLILVCTALGFGAAMLWFREDVDDEWNEDYDDEEEEWPSPPERFPDENPPPIPQDLLDVQQEEE